MSKPPPTKKELERLNADIKRLRAPQPPHMAPAPGGSMRQQATQVQIQARQKSLEVAIERRDEINASFDKVRGVPKRDFNRER